MKFYLVYEYTLDTVEAETLIGLFPSKANAMLFVKHLINKGVEKYFDIRVLEDMTYMDAIQKYQGEERIDRIIATNLTRDKRGRSVFYFYDSGEFIDFKD